MKKAMGQPKTVDTVERLSAVCPFPEPPDKGHIAHCLDVLETTWKQESTPSLTFHDDALDSLVRTVLSQNTNDKNRDRAYENLRRQYPDWGKVLSAKSEDVAEAIRIAGLSKTKAGRIRQILEKVKSAFGRLSLEEMKSWGNTEARLFLENLPGVGPKTAACVLLFDLHMPAFPVDTHVARVSRRIGWVPPKASPEAIQACMEASVSPDRYLGAHLNLILHGRNICRARKPACLACTLKDLCSTGKEQSGI